MLLLANSTWLVPQSISPHVGFASREYNTAKQSSLVSADPGLICLSFKRKIFVRKARLPISDGFVSLYGNSHLPFFFFILVVFTEALHIFSIRIKLN